jgi:arylsulfatase A-like enzyme
MEEHSMMTMHSPRHSFRAARSALCSVWLLGVCLLGCSGKPVESPLEISDLDFRTVENSALVKQGSFGLGPETRPAISPLVPWHEKPLVVRSKPFQVEAGAQLILGLGLAQLPEAEPTDERPSFRVELLHGDRAVQLLELSTLAELPLNQWHDFRLELPSDIQSSQDNEVTLRLEVSTSNPRAMSTGKLIPVWGVPRLTRESKLERPNVLFVVFDTLRADHTQPYGYERETTPFLNQLASQGATVRDAIATYPTTLSSHWSMFTGLFPARHGIYPRRGGVRKPTALTLASQFQQSGYRTAAYTEGAYVHSLFGFHEGFDRYHNGPATELVDQTGAAPQTFALAHEWLSEVRGEPFFMFLHTYQVHGPYAPPAEYRKMFADGKKHRWTNTFPALASFGINDGSIKLSQSELSNIVDLYDAEIRQLDDLFADLWKKLESAGALDNTIVILTSDHGEDFLEHGWLQHGTTLYDPAVRVPLIVVAPGRVAAGTRLDCQRSQTDLMPTILELAGLPVPGGLDGESIAPQLKSGVCEDDSPAFSELLKPTYKRHADLPLVSLRSRGWKLIEHLKSGIREAYALGDDQDEEKNLKIEAVPADVVKMLDEYIESRPPGIDGIVEEISPEVRARLEALGYLP